MNLQVEPFSNVIHGNALDALRLLPSKSVHRVVTSPPYWGLRDYGVDGQIGAEKSPWEYAKKLLAIFHEVRRVLRDDGTFWLNLGDTYAANRSYQCSSTKGGPKHSPAQSFSGSAMQIPKGLKAKDLVGIPWRVAFALQEDGWYLRSDVIWHKPNVMPSSVKDRPTTTHEYVFLLTKKPRYFYDAEAISEPLAVTNAQRTTAHYNTTERYGLGNGGNTGLDSLAFRMRSGTHNRRNRRTVWKISTKSFKGAHFAVFPEGLVEPCVLAGTSEHGACTICGSPWRRITKRVPTGYDGHVYGERAVAASGGAISGGTARSTLGSSQGKLTAQYETTGWEPTCRCGSPDLQPCVVLDPFCGSGTVGVVAKRFGRSFVGIDLNADYCEMARRRIG